MVLLFTDPLFLEHETGNHPETPERLRAVTARLQATGLAGRCGVGVYQPLAVKALAAVHDRAMVSRAQELARRGGGRLDPDTVVSAASFKVALAAAGACAAAVDAVLAGPEKIALCLVRPPGHHATPTKSMGFCLFNNIALAARHALDKHALNRVLIIDWDVHHGNGTQDIFYEDPATTFFSIHRYGMGFYPGTGANDETGSGRGLGHTINAPLRYGTPRPEYRKAFSAALEKAVERSKPELVLLSAGFDAHALDPIGSLGLEVEDFVWMTQQVQNVARACASGRLVSCLEGGYNLKVLAESVQAHLEGLLAG
jgi:acetoin utilization deacetylase AcuC-like enzyme